jgi:hypothetical protein
MAPTLQQARFQELASTRGIDAVTQLALPDGTLILTALKGDEVLVVEALDGNGRPLHELDPVAVLRRLGVVREQALAQAERVLDAIANLTAIRRADGEDVNIAEIAREAGLTRKTLYLRLEAAAIADKRKRSRITS